jgi:osmotically inducible protein OsmC
MATRNGSAEWRGNLKDGDGDLKVGDGVFEGKYSASSRFEEGEGTNPEELIATALAGCFSMALALALADDNYKPERIHTVAKAELRNLDGKPTIAKITLETWGEVPELDQDEFVKYAEKTKEGCIVARALAGVNELSVMATLR